MPFTAAEIPRLPSRVAAAREHFQKGGWSYRTAAAELNVSYQHLCEVLSGKRSSGRLITKVLNLPSRKLQ